MTKIESVQDSWILMLGCSPYTHRENSSSEENSGRLESLLLNVPARFAGNSVADKIRTDINDKLKIPGNHGFQFTIPSQYRDGKSHTIGAFCLQSGPNRAMITILISH